MASTRLVRVTWQEFWYEIFGLDPPDRTSREVSVQELLAFLITARKAAWFVPYDPTDEGATFLRALWAKAFGDAPKEPFDWFVSEYELPVPLRWRDEIGLTYGCPDLACRSADRVLIVELKTEPAAIDGGRCPTTSASPDASIQPKAWTWLSSVRDGQLMRQRVTMVSGTPS